MSDLLTSSWVLRPRHTHLHLRQPCNPATLQPCNPATLQTLQPCNPATLQPCDPATLQPCNPATLQPCDPGPRHHRRPHVLVIGAGMAGLAAAYQLRKFGHRVTVLEAQARFRLLTYLLTYLCTHSFTYLLTHSLTCLLAYSPTDLITYLLTCALTYLLLEAQARLGGRVRTETLKGKHGQT